MKKYCTFLVCILHTMLYSQICSITGSTYNLSVNFDWEKFGKTTNNVTTPHRYDMYVSGGNNTGVFSYTGANGVLTPYESDNNNVKDLYYAWLTNYINLDIYNKDGWELVSQNFGTAANPVSNTSPPYFMLYSRPKGILRIFYCIFNRSNNIQTYQISVKHDNNYSAMLSFAEGRPANAVEDFDPTTEVIYPNIFYNNPRETWLRADIPIAYDPCVCRNPSNFIPMLEISGREVTNMDVKLNTYEQTVGTGTFTGIIGNGPKQEENDFLTSFLKVGTSLAANFTLNIMTGGSYSAIANWVKGSATVGKYKNIMNAVVPESNKGPQQPKGSPLGCPPSDRTYGGERLDAESTAEACTGFSASANASFNVMGLVNSFIGGTNESEPTITSYSQTFQSSTVGTTSGTISSSQFGFNQTIKVPAANKLATSNVLNPIYDNALGVFNLAKTPEVEVYEFTPTITGLIPCNLNLSNVNRYRLKNIDYMINPNAEIEVIDIKASLVFDYTKYPANINMLLGYAGPFLFTNSVADLTPMLNKIGSSGLNIDYAKRNSISINDYIFSSGFINLGCFKDYTFAFYSPWNSPITHPEITLKLMLLYKRKNSTIDEKSHISIQSFKVKIPNESGIIRNNFKYYVTSEIILFTNLCNSTITGIDPIPNLQAIPHANYGDLIINAPVNITTNTTWKAKNVTISSNITTSNNAKLTIISANEIVTSESSNLEGEIEFQIDPVQIFGASCYEPVPQFTDIANLCSQSSKYAQRAWVNQNRIEHPSSTATPASRTSQSARLLAIPNPSYGTTTFYYSVPEEGEVRLYITNTLGQPVAEVVSQLHHPAGQHSKVFTHTHLPTGIYFYTLTTPDGHTETQRLVIIE